jgi:hypothetical protein
VGSAGLTPLFLIFQAQGLLGAHLEEMVLTMVATTNRASRRQGPIQLALNRDVEVLNVWEHTVIVITIDRRGAIGERNRIERPLRRGVTTFLRILVWYSSAGCL